MTKEEIKVLTKIFIKSVKNEEDFFYCHKSFGVLEVPKKFQHYNKKEDTRETTINALNNLHSLILRDQ